MAEDQVLQGVRGLRVAPGSLEQIKSAAVFAAQNASGRVHGQRAESPVRMRVLARNTGGPRKGMTTEARINERGAGESVSSGERSWGFFLIERASDRSPAGMDDPHFTIEVYLYPEGDSPAT